MEHFKIELMAGGVNGAHFFGDGQPAGGGAADSLDFGLRGPPEPVIGDMQQVRAAQDF